MSRFFLVSGNDEFAIKSRAREHVSSLCGEDFESCADLEIIRGDSDQLSVAEVVGQFFVALATPPFLSAQKVIWLCHFTGFDALNAAADKEMARLQAQILAFFKQDLPPEIAVVIDGPGLDLRTSLAKAFKNVPGAVCDFYKKAELADKDYSRNQAERITALAKQQKKQIADDAMEFLISAVGSDFGRLQKEIEKLATYLGDEKLITLQVCRNICSRTPEALGWEFARALTEGDRVTALKLADISIREMRNLRGGGNNVELSLIFQAIRGFKDILDTRLAMDELGLTTVSRNYFYNVPEELKAQFPNNMLLKIHPFRAYKLVESAMIFPEKKLAQAYKALLEANRRMVSGGGDSRMILEDLIVKVTA